MDSVQLNGSIVDESIAGAAIAGLDLLMMAYDKGLTVVHREEQFEANARRVSREDDGRFNLGVIRRDSISDDDVVEDSAMLINCYVKLRDTLAICAPIEIENATQVLVQLWDGMQFRVDKSLLSPMTRAERYQMLSQSDVLQTAMNMYGFAPSSSFYDQRRVFEHEFGIYRDCSIMSRSCQPA